MGDAPSPSGDPSETAGAGAGVVENAVGKRSRQAWESERQGSMRIGDEGWKSGGSSSAGREMKKTKKKRKKKKKRHAEILLKTKAKKKTVQMFLDFGQRAFSKRRCAKCQMLYAPGKPDDEAAHKRFCRRTTRPVQMHVRSGDSVVWSGPHGTGRHATILKFRVNRGEESTSTRIGELFARVQSALDASFDCSTNDSGGSHRGKGNARGNVLVFVYVIGRDAVGYLSAVLLPATIDKNSPRLEVLRIWVEAQFRREKIATRLMDSARLHSLYGSHIKTRQCAMPDRTEDGSLFWSSFVKRKRKRQPAKHS